MKYIKIIIKANYAALAFTMALKQICIFWGLKSAPQISNLQLKKPSEHIQSLKIIKLLLLMKISQ